MGQKGGTRTSRTETPPLVDPMGRPKTFASREAAEARIEELDAAPCTTALSESSRPTYAVAEV